ncbi:multicopper oxidase family protein [Spelaeicoccus albus]|uniref:Spore coat protein A n=1 Tax=Spelaeicoccus albus TaxID=1280376 RepID=A0A7Z0AC20_9MICO|nr:multicopper oxidase domain-containing protein [Spelaeicoccus albus]NYI66898.1 spore coat protein A [Spelaeicoccus albus]
MTPSRRDVLKGSALAAGSLILPTSLAGCGWPVNQSQSSAGAVLSSTARLPDPFTSTLPIPPVLKPSKSDEDGDHYEITQRSARAHILPGPSTPIWGYNGIFPGPTIHARRGRPVLIHQRNQLRVPTVVHLHGGRTPPESDGYPTDYVLPTGGWPASDLHHPGRVHHGSFTYEYPLDQRAATLWYHDHRMDFTGPSVWRGLAGFFLIGDGVEDELPLPRGDRDIPLMIVDRSFAKDSAMHYPSVDPSLRHTPGVTDDFMSGVLGDCILVNGAAWPTLNVSNTRYRFRFLNASNARRYKLALDPKPDDGPSFVQVGSGQGLLRSPHELDAIDIAQAERFDVIVDFSAYKVGQSITLRNEHGSGNTGLVMRFTVTESANDTTRIPAKLSDLEPVPDTNIAAHRTFVFARGGAKADDRVLWTVNGKKFDPARIDARVRRGTTEKWTIRAQNVPHPFHIHEDGFQIVTSNNNSDRPGPYDAGLKDVVNLDNGATGELLIHFSGYPGKYVFHCHNLEHEDMMMMANFEIRD